MTLIQSWPASELAWQRSKKSLAGGVSTGLRASMRPHPLFFSHGRGATLTDIDGNGYVDYVLGWGPVILGHAHPELTAATSLRGSLGATFGACHHLEYETAELLLEMIPGAERVLWSNTGSEANQIAARLARAATGRRHILKMIGSYHGWTDAFLVGYRPDKHGRFDGPGTIGQSPASLGETYLAAWGDLEQVEAMLKDERNDVAAVFIEPVLCNSGVIPPPPGYLEGLRALCDATGTVLVFDEVITGVRIARGGAVEKYGVRPDLIVLAKAIAGGYPLSAVVGRAALIDQTMAGVVHAGTYNGNPVVLAAAQATLIVLSRAGVYEALDARGEQLAHGIESVLAGSGIRHAVTQVGPVVQCFVGTDSASEFGDFLDIDQALYDRITVELLRRGVFNLPGGRWYLSTEHTASEVDDTLAAFAEAVAAVER